MKMSMTRYKGDNMTEILWDKMQSKLGCCGVLSIDDWQNITWSESAACAAPASCKVTVLNPVENRNTTLGDNTNNTVDNEDCFTNITTPHHSEASIKIHSPLLFCIQIKLSQYNITCSFQIIMILKCSS